MDILLVILGINALVTGTQALVAGIMGVFGLAIGVGLLVALFKAAKLILAGLHKLVEILNMDVLVLLRIKK